MDLIFYILATFRISVLLATEAGPWNLLDRLRDLLGVRYDDVGQEYGTNAVSKGILCVWCNSVWVAFGWLLVRLLLPEYSDYLAFSFAVSGGALIIYEAIEWLEHRRPPS